MMSYTLPLLSLLLPALLASTASGANYTVSVPASAPSDAPSIDPNFPAYAFEEASMVEYAQTRSTKAVNQFSLNLMQAVTSRTGGRPVIRLGGTSGDFARFIPNQKAPALPVAEANKGPKIPGVTIGPSYWQLAAQNFASLNATFVVQVPLATTNMSETIAWAKSAVQGIGWDKIEAIEIGNEPDLYGGKRGPPKFQAKLTNASYAKIYKSYAKNVSDALDIPAGRRVYQAFDTSAHFNERDGFVFDVETIFNLGIDARKNIKQVAHHYYQTLGHFNGSHLAAGLMNHTLIASRLDLYKPFISYLKSLSAQNGTDMPFILSEVGNAINQGHVFSYEAVLGSALWQVDFQLHAMSIGVARVHWQQIMAAGFDLWLPVDSANKTARVYAPYYAQPFIADFIGDTGGKTRVAPLPVTGSSGLAAYAAYVGSDPARIAVVNFDFWDKSSNKSRPSSTLKLSDLPSTVKTATVLHLSSPEGAHASADNITYGGSQWTHASRGKEVKGVRNDTQTLQVSGGNLSVNVPASSALLLHLHS